jgi:hypothetical protein
VSLSHSTENGIGVFLTKRHRDEATQLLLAAVVNTTVMAGENLTVGSTVGCRLRA